MRPRLLLSMAALAACLGFAPAPFPRPRQTTPADLQRMQGTWEMIEYHSHGRMQRNFSGQVRVTGARFEFIVRGEVRSRWEMKLDPNASPRTMDRTSLETEGRGHIVLLGVYRFEGERLYVCHDSGEAARPTGFDGKGSEYLMILERSRR